MADSNKDPNSYDQEARDKIHFREDIRKKVLSKNGEVLGFIPSASASRDKNPIESLKARMIREREERLKAGNPLSSDTVPIEEVVEKELDKKQRAFIKTSILREREDRLERGVELASDMEPIEEAVDKRVAEIKTNTDPSLEEFKESEIQGSIYRGKYDHTISPESEIDSKNNPKSYDQEALGELSRDEVKRSILSRRRERLEAGKPLLIDATPIEEAVDRRMATIRARSHDPDLDADGIDSKSNLAGMITNAKMDAVTIPDGHAAPTESPGDHNRYNRDFERNQRYGGLDL